MNPTADSLTLAQTVQERYRRYLKTMFYFRDPELRASFEAVLDAGTLAKGPYLEAMPVFASTETPREIFTRLLGGAPDAGLLRALQGERALYRHQARAIETSAAERNFVVATGTGSGKTESFLYPILLHLYQETRAGTLNRPGVRALVLYPMNALANDQRERLGEIAQTLADTNSPFRFTFGQYIGETPEDEKDNSRNAREFVERRKAGELVFRSEMRENPPHILLTNYSMLEYLLLRPADCKLFDEGRAQFWKFIVLDEAHQYRGARGIEMALLLRRVKQRLREGGRRDAFRCIATSASLVGGDKDAAAVAQFAQDLFDEPFEPRDLILGETVAMPVRGAIPLTAADYQTLYEWFHEQNVNADALAELGARLDIPFDAAQEHAQMLGAWLERDARTERLCSLTAAQTMDLGELALAVFPGLGPREREAALTRFIELVLAAQSPSTGAPLLSARYHLFLRALEGAYVLYQPTKRVLLDRQMQVDGSAAFEVALCRECGQHYFVGRIINGEWKEAVRDPTQDEFGATYLRPLSDDEESSEEDEDADAGKNLDIHFLCAQCGKISRAELSCGHANILRVVKEAAHKDSDRADQLPRCGACGYQAAGRDPVREIIYGADGPHAVIATTLAQMLPQDRRKVLAFADGRQEAAYFAWYLDDSYADVLHRNLLLKAIQRGAAASPDGLALRDVAHYLRSEYRAAKILPAATSELEIKRRVWRDLYREFLTDELRLALEGVGALRWTIQFPEWMETPRVLLDSPWELNEAQARDLMWLLLDTMRYDHAIELLAEEGVEVSWNDLGEHMAPRDFVIGAPNRRKHVKSWDGEHGRRAKFLAKILTQKGFTRDVAIQHAQNALREIWSSIVRNDRDAPSEMEQLWLTVRDGRRLNPNWYRVQPIVNQTLYRCDTCNRLQSVSVQEVCPRRNCNGKLVALAPSELEPNHYRALYQDTLPGALRVEEHTAQLDSDKARAFQREFREGKIHVLSCSTTFELGVDLGTLDTIFLRNVPPETFNYVQRVGRAGRRRGFPGFALTYCRRNPHDLYHFAEPQRMMSGRVNPPVLAIQNDKIISRHITAVALAAFFRAHPERFISVQDFIGDWNAPRAVNDVKQFLYAERARLEISLRAIVPNAMQARIGLEDGTWMERVAGEWQGHAGTESSRLVSAEQEVVSDFAIISRVEREATAQRDYKTAEWARKRADTIARQDTLSFMSRKVVIPKYGFPVDVVELEAAYAQQSGAAFSVELQRDLAIAISEFAPTSELVANKKLWKSYALKRVAEKEWERRYYKRCAKHNVYLEWSEGEAEPSMPCGDRAPKQPYIVPAFGFTTNRDPAKTPSSRPQRVFTTRPYFTRALVADPGVLNFPAQTTALSLYRASPGLMTVLCEGRRGNGFYICPECGAGFRSAEKNHKTAFGQACRGVLERVSLGHSFITDILRFQFRHEPRNGMDPIWFAYSLAYALVEGAAQVLSVPSTDLSATVAHSADTRIPPIVVYDNVPGGAGLVSRLENKEILRATIGAARERVNGNCGCGDETSCYGCLRSYRNQFAHQSLQRGPVLEYLDTLIAIWE
jgi:hypothetical protein